MFEAINLLACYDLDLAANDYRETFEACANASKFDYTCAFSPVNLGSLDAYTFTRADLIALLSFIDPDVKTSKASKPELIQLVNSTYDSSQLLIDYGRDYLKPKFKVVDLVGFSQGDLMRFHYFPSDFTGSECDVKSELEYVAYSTPVYICFEYEHAGVLYEYYLSEYLTNHYEYDKEELLKALISVLPTTALEYLNTNLPTELEYL